MTAKDRGLFPEVKPEPVPKPRAKRKGKGPVKYAASSAKFVRCEDCEVVIYELLMADRSAPMVRMARWRRTQGDMVIPLCSEHKNDRELEEA